MGAGRASGSESVSVFRSALHEGVATATLDGQPIAKLMGEFSGYDGNSTYFDIGPFSDFLAYPDHGVIYRFAWRAARHTEMELDLAGINEEAVEAAGTMTLRARHLASGMTTSMVGR